MRDYHNPYLAVDTLQLACVFEPFREAMFQSFCLDAAQYFSASNISGDAFSKICAAVECLWLTRDTPQVLIPS